MALNRQELFEKLLEQVHFPEKGNPAFKGAAVQSVVVHKNSRRWEFHLILRRPLSLNLFKELYQAVRVGFKDIAEVDLQLAVPRLRSTLNWWPIIGSTLSSMALWIHQCYGRPA